MPAHKKTFDEQFWPKVDMDPNSGCWLWNGAVSKKTGYARIQYQGRCREAHIVSYEEEMGPVPDGFDLDHKCRTRPCVNFDHLEPVTPLENIRRSPIHVGARTHCPHGHAYDEANTYRHRGERRCRACHATYARKQRAKRCR